MAAVRSRVAAFTKRRRIGRKDSKLLPYIPDSLAKIFNTNSLKLALQEAADLTEHLFSAAGVAEE